MGTKRPAPPHAPAQTNEGGATPMIKLMRLCLWLSIFAAVIGSARAGPAIGGEGPGKGYAQVPQGAYSVVAEVRAKPGKEAECVRLLCRWSHSCEAIRRTSSIFYKRIARPRAISSFMRSSLIKPISMPQCNALCENVVRGIAGTRRRRGKSGANGDPD